MEKISSIATLSRFNAPAGGSMRYARSIAAVLQFKWFKSVRVIIPVKIWSKFCKNLRSEATTIITHRQALLAAPMPYTSAGLYTLRRNLTLAHNNMSSRCPS